MLEPENSTHHYLLLAALVKDGFGLLYVDSACLLGKSFEAYCKEKFPDLDVADVKLLVDWFHANCHVPSCRYSPKNGKYAQGTGASGAYDAPEPGWALGVHAARNERSMAPHRRLEAIELRLERVAEHVADHFFDLLAKRQRDNNDHLKEMKAKKAAMEKEALDVYKLALADLQVATAKATADIGDRETPAALSTEVDFALHDLKVRIFSVPRTPDELELLLSTLLSSVSLTPFNELVKKLKKARGKLEAEVGVARLNRLAWPAAGRAWVPLSPEGRELLEQAVKAQMRKAAAAAEEAGVDMDRCMFEMQKPHVFVEDLRKKLKSHKARLHKAMRKWTWWHQLDFEAADPVAKAGWEELAKGHFDRACARAPGPSRDHLEAVHTYPWYEVVQGVPCNFFLEYGNVCAKVDRRNEQKATFLPNDLQHGLKFCKAYQAKVEQVLFELDRRIATLRNAPAAPAAELRKSMSDLSYLRFQRYSLLSHNDKASRWLQRGRDVAAKWEDGQPFVPKEMVHLHGCKCGSA